MILLSWESQSSLISNTGYHMPHINSLKKLRLFSFLAILLLAACKKQDESFGESLQPEEDFLNAFQTDSTPLHASILKKEPVRIDIYANYMIGNYVDEIFGTTRCSGVMQFAPSSTSSSPFSPDDAADVAFEIDSVTLDFAYQKFSYGNNAPMTFVVNELTELLDISTDYYSDKTVTKNALNLIVPGSEVHETYPDRASFTATDPKIYLRLKLRNEFGHHLLTECDLEDFDSFKNDFNGLVVSSSTIDGRVLSFAAINTKLTVHYKKILNQQTFETIDSLSFNFENTSACESFTITENQYFGSELSSLTSSHEINGDELCYVQAPHGTRVRVDLSEIFWLQQIPGAVINKAELVVPFENDNRFDPLDALSISYKKEDGSYTFIPDTLYTGGGLNTSTGAYKFDISRHVKDILSGDVSSTDVYLTNNPLVNGLFNSTGVKRTIIHGPSFSPTDRSRNMRIVVTYSY